MKTALTQEILENITSLPPDMQQEALDFVLFLKHRRSWQADLMPALRQRDRPCGLATGSAQRPPIAGKKGLMLLDSNIFIYSIQDGYEQLRQWCMTAHCLRVPRFTRLPEPLSSWESPAPAEKMLSPNYAGFAS